MAPGLVGCIQLALQQRQVVASRLLVGRRPVVAWRSGLGPWRRLVVAAWLAGRPGLGSLGLEDAAIVPLLSAAFVDPPKRSCQLHAGISPRSAVNE